MISLYLLQPTPVTPPRNPAEFLPWVISVLLGGLLFLFWLREKERREQLTELKAEKKVSADERERERKQHQDTLDSLGERLDEQVNLRARDQQRMATLILLSRKKLDEPEDYEDSDMPTGVHQLLQVIPTPESRKQMDAKLEERLRNFDPYHPTTPPAPRPPRPRMKSRPDR